MIHLGEEDGVSAFFMLDLVLKSTVWQRVLISMAMRYLLTRKSK
jgi:hypothetical protein